MKRTTFYDSTLRIESEMLLYEYRIREHFDQVRDLAERIRAKFDKKAEPDELLQDTEILRRAYESLAKVLPAGVDAGNAQRHLFFMRKHLQEGSREACTTDIDDICTSDLRLLEDAFKKWCASQVHYDTELSREIVDLLEDKKLDSAVRSAFVILKARIVSSFNLPENLDGRQLVNTVFGSAGILNGKLSDPERESTRNLLDGLYGVFRNLYGHNPAKPEWHEAEAVISMINFTLKKLGDYRDLV